MMTKASQRGVWWKTNMKISFITLGCKLNQAESDNLKQSLLQRGFSVVPIDRKPDLAIIRACGVTCKASQTSREMVKKFKKQNIYTIATGCLENTDLKQIDFHANSNKEIIEHLEKIRSHFSDTCTKYDNTTPERTRKLIKIQTGCNFQCSYCIIPKFRGRSQSIPKEKIIDDVKKCVTQGYNEIVLTGVNICQYNDDGHDLSSLITKILNKTKIPRIRLGSLDPRLITKELVALYNEYSDRLLPHFHLSLQSGSDTVLKAMKRGYTAKQYKDIIRVLRMHNPLFSVTTDIIVGFPAEDKIEFKKTMDFVKKIQFTKIHIFPFSPRPNTEAYDMKPIHNQIVTDRVKELTTIAKKGSERYIQQFINQELPVLFEYQKNNTWYGYTPQYFRIKYKSKQNLTNTIKKITINKNNIY